MNEINQSSGERGEDKSDIAVDADPRSRVDVAAASAVPDIARTAAANTAASVVLPRPVAPAPAAPAAAPAGPVLSAAVAAAVTPADAAEEKAQRLAAARKRLKANRTKPLKFVVFTLGLWWLLSVLADLVITCSPGGPPCRAPYLIEATKRHVASIFNGAVQISGAAGQVSLTKYEWPLLIISLLGALWVAKAKVYPRSDETEEFTEQELDET